MLLSLPPLPSSLPPLSKHSIPCLPLSLWSIFVFSFLPDWHFAFSPLLSVISQTVSCFLSVYPSGTLLWWYTGRVSLIKAIPCIPFNYAHLFRPLINQNTDGYKKGTSVSHAHPHSSLIFWQMPYFYENCTCVSMTCMLVDVYVWYASSDVIQWEESVHSLCTFARLCERVLAAVINVQIFPSCT